MRLLVPQPLACLYFLIALSASKDLAMAHLKIFFIELKFRRTYIRLWCIDPAVTGSVFVEASVIFTVDLTAAR